MNFNGFYLTLYERIAIQVILLYQEKVVGVGLDDVLISSDAELRNLVATSAEWYRKTDSYEIESSPKYEYIKRENERYLDIICSDAFLSGFSEEFRRFLRMYYCL